MTTDNRTLPAYRVSIRAEYLLLTMLALPAWGQLPSAPANAGATFTPDIDAKCPEAVRELAEFRALRKRPQVPGTVTRPALRENLLLMAKQDQAARALLSSSGLRNDLAGPDALRMIDVDSANLKRLKHIVNQDGLPSAEMVGLDGVNAAWLLTLHADRDRNFQETVLKLASKHVRRGEVRSDQVAMLTDGLLSSRGERQRYGTNFELRDGELKPAPMEDEAHVDERRRAVGLGSLANYTCVIRASYGSPKPQTPGSTDSAP